MRKWIVKGMVNGRVHPAWGAEWVALITVLNACGLFVWLIWKIVKWILAQ